MPRFTVKHHQAVWETTTFEVEAEDLDSVRENLDELMCDAVSDERATVECGDSVRIDDDVRIYNESGTEVFSGLDGTNTNDETG
jgi:hypothetical protein